MPIPESQLRKLLLSLGTRSQLKLFIEDLQLGSTLSHELPGATAPDAEFVSAFVGLMGNLGRLNYDFFGALISWRPGRLRDMLPIMTSWLSCTSELDRMDDTPCTGTATLDENVTLFISHKVSLDRKAARTIKDVLESRSDRIRVHICETILAGDNCREWINNRIANSNVMLILAPEATSDSTGINREVATFSRHCPNGRLITLKKDRAPVPSILEETHVINVIAEEIFASFLVPLFKEPTFANLSRPINPQISDSALFRDAQLIEAAISGQPDAEQECCNKSLVIDIKNVNVGTEYRLPNSAMAEAMESFEKILNWRKRSFTWQELSAKADERRGRGTYWMAEIAQIIRAVVKEDGLPVMTATLRGRGELKGMIFKPQLQWIETVNSRPTRISFSFHEVLQPELVRGKNAIGGVFNLLYLATRSRWEVMDPYYVKYHLKHSGWSQPIDAHEKSRIAGTVSQSIRSIEAMAERHNMLADSVAESGFCPEDERTIATMILARQPIRAAIMKLNQGEHYDELMDCLQNALILNVKATVLLARQFLNLAMEDLEQIKELVGQDAFE